MQRIAIINQKGGVAKTTTAANLGAAFARGGSRVLLIDLDSQANLSLHVSGEAGLADDASTFELLVDGVPIRDAARALPDEGLTLVQASGDLAGIEQALANTIGRELLLRDALEKVESDYDIVLIDCPPSLGVLSLNALAAAQHVLIPLQTEFFALQGMAQLLDVVGVVQKRLNPSLAILGILPSMIDARTRLSGEVVDELAAHFADLLLETRIRKNVKLAEAPSFGQSILRYAPESNGAADYMTLARELSARLGLAIRFATDAEPSGAARPGAPQDDGAPVARPAPVDSREVDGGSAAESAS
ncbi:MAG: ParA family protein [Planctomycetes bacterium]|nr:ParA family protein [Planctomycetota bacterium]